MTTNIIVTCKIRKTNICPFTRHTHTIMTRLLTIFILPRGVALSLQCKVTVVNWRRWHIKTVMLMRVRFTGNTIEKKKLKIYLSKAVFLILQVTLPGVVSELTSPSYFVGTRFFFPSSPQCSLHQRLIFVLLQCPSCVVLYCIHSINCFTSEWMTVWGPVNMWLIVCWKRL